MKERWSRRGYIKGGGNGGVVTGKPVFSIPCSLISGYRSGGIFHLENIPGFDTDIKKMPGY